MICYRSVSSWISPCHSFGILSFRHQPSNPLVTLGFFIKCYLNFIYDRGEMANQFFCYDNLIFESSRLSLSLVTLCCWNKTCSTARLSFWERNNLSRRYSECAGAVPCGYPIAHRQSHGPPFYMVLIVKGHRRRLFFLLGWSISSLVTTPRYNQL